MPLHSRPSSLAVLTPISMTLIFFGILALSYFFLFEGELKKYANGGSFHRETEEKLLSERSTYLASLTSLHDSYGVHGQDPQDPLSLMLPTTKDIPLIFANFEALARRQGVGLQVVSVSSGQDIQKKGSSTAVHESLVTMKFSNVDYAKLKVLLDDIEHDAHLIDVVSFDFDPGSHFLSLTAKMYYGG